MKCKNILLVASLLFGMVVNAQETEVKTPPQGVVIENAEKHEEGDIVDFPDETVEYPGGLEEMVKYIRDNVQYPEYSREKGEEGRVYVVFIVEVDGSVSNIEVMRGGVSDTLNAEAIRVVREMPNWKPAEVDDKAVRSRCRLPITFSLGEPEEAVEPKKKGLFRRRR